MSHPPMLLPKSAAAGYIRSALMNRQLGTSKVRVTYFGIMAYLGLKVPFDVSKPPGSGLIFQIEVS